VIQARRLRLAIPARPRKAIEPGAGTKPMAKLSVAT
jgi:hypothetical protein